MQPYTNRYSAELNLILNTPPRWIVKYGQSITLLFFIAALSLLLFMPNKQTTSFDIIVTGQYQHGKYYLVGRILHLSKRDFSRLGRGQQSSISLYNGVLKKKIIALQVDSTYYDRLDPGAEYCVVFKTTDNIISALKSNDVGLCSVETKNSVLLNFK